MAGVIQKGSSGLDSNETADEKNSSTGKNDMDSPGYWIKMSVKDLNKAQDYFINFFQEGEEDTMILDGLKKLIFIEFKKEEGKLNLKLDKIIFCNWLKLREYQKNEYWMLLMYICIYIKLLCLIIIIFPVENGVRRNISCDFCYFFIYFFLNNKMFLPFLHLCVS